METPLKLSSGRKEKRVERRAVLHCRSLCLTLAVAPHQVRLERATQKEAAAFRAFALTTWKSVYDSAPRIVDVAITGTLVCATNHTHKDLPHAMNIQIIRYFVKICYNYGPRRVPILI